MNETHRPLPDEITLEALTPLAREEHLDALTEGLIERGWWVDPNGLDDALLVDLQAELQALLDADELERAGVGRELDYQLAASIRRDSIVWLNRQRPIQARFLDVMEALRLRLNRSLFLGLFEFEGHFAHYPEGGFYKRHYDSFRGAANRLVSVVVYLNDGWQPGDGGELAIYRENAAEPEAVIAPIGGTLVVFLSEEVPHEVLPTQRPRSSIAGWFRLNASIGNQIDPPR
ncbi:MAG: 2OG-Fe(II) oxygenase [Wenzhouxiangella sp.]